MVKHTQTANELFESVDRFVGLGLKALKLNQSIPMFLFYIPWKHKTIGFLVFLGDAKRVHRLEMGYQKDILFMSYN